jgi:hypothetical protein
MFTTPELIRAETAYRQERIKRQFGAATRRERAERLEPRHSRPRLRLVSAHPSAGIPGSRPGPTHAA